MSTYREVDFYDLCRLCMCAGGKKRHISKDLSPSKLEKCLPLKIKESDNLPKSVCENCATKIENFHEFIDKCVNTESMLKSYWAKSCSDQMQFQGKVYVQESIEYKPKKNVISTNKNDISNDTSTMATKQSMSNCVQKNDDINGQYQDFCKDHIQPVIKSKTDVVESLKCDYAIATSSKKSAQTDSSINEKNANENVQDIHSISKGDSKMNITNVTPLTEDPEMSHSQFNKSDCNDEGSDEVKINMNKFLPKHGAINNNNLTIISAKDLMPPRFSCEVCKKKFVKKQHFISHKAVHSGERPYSCGTCSKSFKIQGHLTRHVSIHLEQQFYECDVCHKSFNRNDNLLKHRRKHGVAGPLGKWYQD